MAVHTRLSKAYQLLSCLNRRSLSSVKGKTPVSDKNLKPYSIGKLKTWDSRWWIPTRGRFTKEKMPELTIDDMFITNFIRGTFPMNIKNPVIISRKENIINVTLPLMMDPIPMNFLVGYSETLLSEWLGCIVYVKPCCVLPKELL